MISFRTFFLLAILSLTQGSNSLEGNLDTASCSGSITDLAVLSASCGENSSCTFGSVLEISGQGTEFIGCAFGLALLVADIRN